MSLSDIVEGTTPQSQAPPEVDFSIMINKYKNNNIEIKFSNTELTLEMAGKVLLLAVNLIQERLAKEKLITKADPRVIEGLKKK